MTTPNAVDARLARRFIREQPRETARMLERMPPEQAAAALEGSESAAARVLEHMERDAAAACLAELDSDERARVIESLPLDVAARLLRLLPKAERERGLAACGRPYARSLERMLRFPEQTAGALMDPNPLTARTDATAGEVASSLDQRADDVLYVVDKRDKLAGMLAVRDLVRAPRDALLDTQMTRAAPHIRARADSEDILAHEAWHHHHQLPVVDRHGTLLGVLRYHTMRALGRGRSRADPPGSLGLALSEMYWDVMSALVDAVGRAASPSQNRQETGR